VISSFEVLINFGKTDTIFKNTPALKRLRKKYFESKKTNLLIAAFVVYQSVVAGAIGVVDVVVDVVGVVVAIVPQNSFLFGGHSQVND